MHDQPFGPRQPREDEVHDGPEDRVVDVVANHRRAEAEDGVDESEETFHG